MKTTLNPETAVDAGAQYDTAATEVARNSSARDAGNNAARWMDCGVDWIADFSAEAVRRRTRHTVADGSFPPVEVRRGRIGGKWRFPDEPHDL